MLSLIDILDSVNQKICENWDSYKFMVERDVVWTFQKELTEILLPIKYKIFNDYKIVEQNWIDLIIFDDKDNIVMGIEFKYEPSHKRTDIQKTKFPVVFWEDGVLKDILRVEKFKAIYPKADFIALLFDEGGYFASKELKEESKWVQINEEVKVLYTKY